jgi:hypothetical protein
MINFLLLLTHNFAKLKAFGTDTILIQRKLLNVIILGQIKTDNINQMITISE